MALMWEGDLFKAVTPDALSLHLAEHLLTTHTLSHAKTIAGFLTSGKAQGKEARAVFSVE